jgi:hypothetical protein
MDTLFLASTILIKLNV